MAGGIRESDDLEEAHEINVTPFIDVMLVLLIIFMVAAPLSTVDVPVNLPQSGVPPAERPEEPLIVTLKQDLTLNLGNAPIPRETLAAQLMTAAGGKPETRIYLRADKAVPYGELMTVMSLLREGGFHQVALMAEQTLP